MGQTPEIDLDKRVSTAVRRTSGRQGGRRPGSRPWNSRGHTGVTETAERPADQPEGIRAGASVEETLQDMRTVQGRDEGLESEAQPQEKRSHASGRGWEQKVPRKMPWDRRGYVGSKNKQRERKELGWKMKEAAKTPGEAPGGV